VNKAKKKSRKKLGGGSGGGFQKAEELSEELAKFVGAKTMSRSQVVKKLWAYIREKNLQNPRNKTDIRCDSVLSKLFFEQRKVTAFSMMKYLAMHFPYAATKPSSEDMENGEQAKKKAPGKKRKKSGEGGERAESGLGKPKRLSDTLAEFLGEPLLPRTMVVKKLWEYIKANELQDPNNRRNINPDEKMVAAFKGRLPKKLTMFSINKYIGEHLFDEDD